MSNVTRLLLGVPLEIGSKYKQKTIGNITLTRIKNPNNTIETAIIENTKEGKVLKKAVFSNESQSIIIRDGQEPIKICKKTGKKIDIKA